MKQTIRLSAIIFFQLILRLCIAQNNELQFIKIDGPNGKPIGKIRNITQDPYGYMWFSGEGENCIYRYDGIRITAFRHDEKNSNSLGGTYVGSVYADDEGIIWIGMVEGLDRFDPTTGVFIHFRHNPNDPGSLSGGVNPILRDSKGRLWVGTGKGLDRLDEKTGKFIHYRNEPGNPKSLSSNTVVTIYEDHQGVIWIGTNYPWDNKNPDVGGLNRMEPDGTFTRFMHDPNDPHSLINNKVGAIFEDSRGVFWVGTGGDGLHTMDRKTGRFERHTFDPSNPDKLSCPPLKKEIFDIERVCFIQEDVMGSIWIGTMGSGINRYDTLTKKITHYEASNGFPDQSGWNIYQSRDGVLWISTQEDNLYRVDPFNRRISSTPLSGTPWCRLEDNENLWVGTEGEGLLQYDLQGALLGQFKHKPADNNSLFDRSNLIYTMFHDQGDTVWIGTSDGPGFFNKSTKQFSRLPINIKYGPDNGKNVPDLLKDRDGLIWFIINGTGLIRYNPSDHSFKQFQNNPHDTTSIISDHVVSIFEDKSGVIWVGDISGGVNRLDKANDTFKHYLRTIPCHKLFEDSQGILWIGTNAGPYIYHPDKDRFLPFLDPESDVAHLQIINIKEDNEKNLWMHNTSELIRVNRATKETYVYSTRFGIAEYTITPLGFCKNRKGEFVLNHQKGFYTFYPEDLAVDIYPLRIILTDFFINALPILPGNESVLKTPVEEVDELELAYNQNNISFNFVAIDYRSPERIKYFTRLDGYDSTWREVKGEKSVSYFSLPTGKFVFRVKAYNLEGTMGEKVIIIHILAPWWQTWWAYTAYLLFFGFAVWLTSIWRERNLQRQNKSLEEKVSQRTEALNKSLNELKSTQAQLIQSEKMASLGQLIAGIAHEINTPLGAINASINTITDSSQQSIKLLPALVKDLSDDELKLFMELVNRSAINNNSLSSKEEREIRRKISTRLEEKEIAEADGFADILVDMGIYDDIENYLPLFKPQTMQTAYHLSMQIKNSQNIKMAVDRASKVVFALKNYARYGNEQSMVEANIVDGLETVLTLYQNQMKHGITLHKEFEEVPQILCYPDELNQVWTNLIHNAIQAMEGKGELSISVSKNPKTAKNPTVSISDPSVFEVQCTKNPKGFQNLSGLMVQITDTGKGIPPEIKDRIFDAFFTTKPAGEGSGLGLYIVKQIIDKHKGTITFESGPTKGTCFKVFFPIIDSISIL
ncbi:MAG: two-component regulator propeller domain-containing protein [Bacteroidales bacterium]